MTKEDRRVYVNASSTKRNGLFCLIPVSYLLSPFPCSGGPESVSEMESENELELQLESESGDFALT